MEGKEEIMSIENRLHEASFSGNVDLLNQLMVEDRLSLARSSTISFNETPLHIASMLGHVDFAQALVAYRPELAGEVDCRGLTPLHLASANGYVGIVKVLLQVNSDACLVRDEEGRTPLCLAVMKGRIEVAEELIRVKPEAAEYSLNATGETLLHLAVKYNRFDCLKMLVERAREGQDVLNTKDNSGNTILHLAVCLKQTETVKYLLGAGITMDAVNLNGLTALVTVENMPRDLKAVEILMMLSETAGGIRPVAGSNIIDNGRNVNLPKREEDWADNSFSGLTVAATVVASMAYQAVLNPPGGIWTSDSGKDDKQQFKAGTSIFATKHTIHSRVFWICNTILFASSFTILCLLVSGFSARSKWAMMVDMWIIIISIIVAYSSAMWTLQPETEKLSTALTPYVSMGVWLLLFLVFAFFILVCKKLRKSRLSRRASASTGQVSV